MIKRLQFSYLYIIPIIAVLFLLLRIHFNIPVTFQESVEGYASYYLGNTGKLIDQQILLRITSDSNETPSILAPFVRWPLVTLFGLNNLAVRLPTVIFAVAGFFLFIKWLTLIRKDLSFTSDNAWKYFLCITAILFTSSGWLIEVNILNLGLTLSLGLIFASLILSFYSKTYLSLLCLFLASWASVLFLPAALFLYIYQIWQLRSKAVMTLIVFLILLTFPLYLMNPLYRQAIIGQSIISKLQPSAYNWEVDRGLAYDQVEGSPLYTQKFNFNRIIHNKIGYGIKNLFYYLTIPWDIDNFISPFQRPEVKGEVDLSKAKFPRIFFLELPFLLIGLVKLLKDKSKILYLGITGILPGLFFPSSFNSLFFLTPFILISEAVGIFLILEFVNVRFRYFLLSGVLFSFIVYQVILQDLLVNHQAQWMAEQDFRQFQIWSYLNCTASSNKVTVTDRLGKPQAYLLYYTKYPPRVLTEDYSRNKYLTEIGRYSFKSFKYQESDRKPSQRWVGIAGEFVGKFNNYKGVEKITDGIVDKKFGDIKQADEFLGDELWIVETIFKPK